MNEKHERKGLEKRTRRYAQKEISANIERIRTEIQRNFILYILELPWYRRFAIGTMFLFKARRYRKLYDRDFIHNLVRKGDFGDYES